MPEQTIGFIGLGNMGLPMAANLAQAGFVVHGYDAQLKETDNAPQNLTLFDDLHDCVKTADVVFTMLPNGAIVLDVVEAILRSRSKPVTVIDCSTIDINDARKAHEQVTAKGFAFFDAPVSGGITGAAKGTLTAMVGGEEAQLASLQDVLAPLFSNIVYCGAPGNGQAAKLCNNMLLATSMIGAGETFNLGAQLGLDPQTLYSILSSSTGSCWSVNQYCPVAGVGPQSPADNDYQPGFSGYMMLKDMKLTQDAARSVSVATPLGKHALQLYDDFVTQGGGPKDFSAIIQYLQALER